MGDPSAGLPSDLSAELDRQLQRLLDLGYPALAGLTADELTARVASLRDLVAGRPVETGAGTVPVLLVVRDSLVPVAAAVERVRVRGRAGWTDMAGELSGYRPIAGVDLPPGEVYLLLDVSTGPDTLGVAPREALPGIVAAGRTPLTIEEGLALMTHRPEVFAEHNAYQALGSRAANKRIPSFWVSKGAPRLGWCWEGNPHSWLGAGSAATRVGAAAG
ncbi:DUF5701 family protein [Ornithinicoccus halotolerans]|uniref:DUF5701 family protein n=1 Tax=Ornithinicoccus halotolerans TaxID=1748220 RepID=UPI001297F83D|nr:DUF5701 family protein [Ornithinicoccus halotolerans]